MDTIDVASDSKTGAGKDLTLSLPENLTKDSFIAIRATKTHTTTIDPHKSTLFLASMSAVLVKPDVKIALKLNAQNHRFNLASPHSSQWRAAVFYEFTTLADNKVQGLPVYFHQRDYEHSNRIKGWGSCKCKWIWSSRQPCPQKVWQQIRILSEHRQRRPN